jgi:hypothetical protein
MKHGIAHHFEGERGAERLVKVTDGPKVTRYSGKRGGEQPIAEPPKTKRARNRP